MNAELDRYIGYWEPYATSHDALDKEDGIHGEVRNAARTLMEAAHANHAGKPLMSGQKLKPARQK
jgi:hypothetical protein